jgi:hypothetical protein
MKKNSDWVVGTNDLGQATLKWQISPKNADTTASDPYERTYDFLGRLDAGLSLQREPAPKKPSCDPYNSGAYDVRSVRARPGSKR